MQVYVYISVLNLWWWFRTTYVMLDVLEAESYSDSHCKLKRNIKHRSQQGGLSESIIFIGVAAAGETEI